MKILHSVKILILVLIALTGCVRTKQLHYFSRNGVVPDSLKSEVKRYEYKLQKGDIVTINISSVTSEKYNFLTNTSTNSSQDPLLSGYLISNDGTVEISVIGKVKLEKLTILEAQDTLKAQISKYLESPVVVVKLLNFTITVLGEVGYPGRFTVYSNRITILDALGMAKDITDFGNRTNVMLLREVNNTIEHYKINLQNIESIKTEYYYLKPNDTIIVSPLRTKAVSVYQIKGITIAASIITALSLLIYRLK